MNTSFAASRRNFLKTSFLGSLALAGGGFGSVARAATESASAKAPTRLALATGTDRVAMAFDGLKPFAEELKRAIASRRVVIKPNNVAIDTPLCATHATPFRASSSSSNPSANWTAPSSPNLPPAARPAKVSTTTSTRALPASTASSWWILTRKRPRSCTSSTRKTFARTRCAPAGRCWTRIRSSSRPRASRPTTAWWRRCR